MRVDEMEELVNDYRGLVEKYHCIVKSKDRTIIGLTEVVDRLLAIEELRGHSNEGFTNSVKQTMRNIRSGIYE